MLHRLSKLSSDMIQYRAGSPQNAGIDLMTCTRIWKQHELARLCSDVEESVQIWFLGVMMQLLRTALFESNLRICYRSARTAALFAVPLGVGKREFDR